MCVPNVMGVCCSKKDIFNWDILEEEKKEPEMERRNIKDVHNLFIHLNKKQLVSELEVNVSMVVFAIWIGTGQNISSSLFNFSFHWAMSIIKESVHIAKFNGYTYHLNMLKRNLLIVYNYLYEYIISS